MKDLLLLIGINTRRVGEAAALCGDRHTFDLVIKFSNTFISTTMKTGDVTSASTMVNQYKILGQFVVSKKTELQDSSVLEIARFLRYYCVVCTMRNLAFLIEIIAHDVADLCQTALIFDSAQHVELLRIFLSFDDSSEMRRHESFLKGVRRAQIKLGTTYLIHNRAELALQIQMDMVEESAELMGGLWDDILNLNKREFWEISDRGTNVNYFKPEQIEVLPQFFRMFENVIASSKAKEAEDGSETDEEGMIIDGAPESGLHKDSVRNIHRDIVVLR